VYPLNLIAKYHLNQTQFTDAQMAHEQLGQALLTWGTIRDTTPDVLIIELTRTFILPVRLVG
jgi:hypothetical protein